MIHVPDAARAALQGWDVLAPFLAPAAATTCAACIAQDAQPLVLAAAVGDVVVVAALLRAGAPVTGLPTGKNPSCTAVDIAIRFQHWEVVAQLRRRMMPMRQKTFDRHRNLKDASSDGKGQRIPSKASPLRSPEARSLASSSGGYSLSATSSRRRIDTTVAVQSPKVDIAATAPSSVVAAAIVSARRGEQRKSSGDSGQKRKVTFNLPSPAAAAAGKGAGMQSTPFVQPRPAIITVTRQVPRAYAVAVMRGARVAFTGVGIVVQALNLEHPTPFDNEHLQKTLLQAYTGHQTPVLALWADAADERVLSMSVRSLCMHHIKTGYLEWRVVLPAPRSSAPTRTVVRVGGVICVASGAEVLAFAAKTGARVPVLLTLDTRPRRASFLLWRAVAAQAAEDTAAVAALEGVGGHTDAISCMSQAAVDARAGVIVTGSWDSTVALWEVRMNYIDIDDTSDRRGQEAKPVIVARRWRSVQGRLAAPAEGAGHAMAVTCVVVAELNNGGVGLGRLLLLSGSLDGHIRRWDAARGTCLFVTASPHAAGVTSLLFVRACRAQTSDAFVSAAAGDVVRCWGADDGALRWMGESHDMAVNALATDRLGLLYVGTTAGVRICDVFGEGKRRHLAPARTATAADVREFHVAHDGWFVDVITRRSIERHQTGEEFALLWTSLPTQSTATGGPSGKRRSDAIDGSAHDAAATLALEFEPIAVHEIMRARGLLRCSVVRRSDGSLWSLDWSGLDFRPPFWRACGERSATEGKPAEVAVEADSDEVRQADGVDTAGKLGGRAPPPLEKMISLLKPNEPLHTIVSERWGEEALPSPPSRVAERQRRGAPPPVPRRVAHDISEVVCTTACVPPAGSDVASLLFAGVGYRELTPYVGRSVRVQLDASWRGGPTVVNASVADITDDGFCSIKFEQPQWDAEATPHNGIERVPLRLMKPAHPRVYCVQAWDAMTGKLRWQCPREDALKSLLVAPITHIAVQCPASGVARLLVACGGEPTGDIHCIAARAGELLFSVRTWCTLLSLVVDSRAAYVGCTDGTVRCMDTTDAPYRHLCAWANASTTGQPVRLEASERNGVVFAASHASGNAAAPDGALRALDSREGFCLWEARAGETAFLVVPPAALGRGAAGVIGDVVITAAVTEVRWRGRGCMRCCSGGGSMLVCGAPHASASLTVSQCIYSPPAPRRAGGRRPRLILHGPLLPVWRRARPVDGRRPQRRDGCGGHAARRRDAARVHGGLRVCAHERRGHGPGRDRDAHARAARPHRGARGGRHRAHARHWAPRGALGLLEPRRADRGARGGGGVPAARERRDARGALPAGQVRAHGHARARARAALEPRTLAPPPPRARVRGRA